MEVLFLTRKDQQLYSSRAALVRRFGFEEADLIMRRLAQLRAAPAGWRDCSGEGDSHRDH